MAINGKKRKKIRGTEVLEEYDFILYDTDEEGKMIKEGPNIKKQKKEK